MKWLHLWVVKEQLCSVVIRNNLLAISMQAICFMHTKSALEQELIHKFTFDKKVFKTHIECWTVETVQSLNAVKFEREFCHIRGYS